MPCAAGRGAGTPHSDRPINAKTASWNRNHRNRRAVVMLCGLAACRRWGRRCWTAGCVRCPHVCRWPWQTPQGSGGRLSGGRRHRWCPPRLSSRRDIPFLPPAHIAFSGTLHLVDLVPGIFLPVVLDVPGVQLFQLVAVHAGGSPSSGNTAKKV